MRTGETRSAAWVVTFSSGSQADRFATAYAKRIGASAEGGRFKLAEKDHTVSTVKRGGETVVVLSHVPPAQVDALEAAGAAALR